MLLFTFSWVLTLWFDYGYWPEVNKALVEGIKTIQMDTWISHAHFRFAFIVMSVVIKVLETEFFPWARLVLGHESSITVIQQSLIGQ